MVRDGQLCYGWSIMVRGGQLWLWSVMVRDGQFCLGMVSSG